MNSLKERIIISVPLVWGIRNYLLSGITDELEKTYEVHYAIPAIGKSYFLNAGVSEGRLIVLTSQKSSTLQRWCNIVVRNAHKKRFPTRSDEVFKPILPKSTGLIRNLLLGLTSRLFSNSFLFGLLESMERRLFVGRIDSRLSEQIKSVSPAFALSTSFVVDMEWSLFRMLHYLKVPIYTHILSFDNLTSRGYLPIKYFNEFLVWNEKMAEELMRMYSIPPSRITITGTPQFDFHTNEKFRRSRDWTRSRLGLGDGSYIVYCANHKALTPDEPFLVESIIKEFQGNLNVNSFEMVLRLHPMDDYDRWNDLLTRYPYVKISYPWPHHSKEDTYWGHPTLEDLVTFSNILRYSALVLNIASSISIDAAIFDKPVICVGFSSDPSNEYHGLYQDFHYSHHYEPIIRTGATPLATDMRELMEFVKDGIDNPGRLSQNRKEMVRLLCGNVDGHATDRILDFINKHNG